MQRKAGIVAKIDKGDVDAMSTMGDLFTRRQMIDDQIKNLKAQRQDIQAQIVVAKDAMRRVADVLDADPTA